MSDNNRGNTQTGIPELDTLLGQLKDTSRVIAHSLPADIGYSYGDRTTVNTSPAGLQHLVDFRNQPPQVQLGPKKTVYPPPESDQF